MKPSSNCGCNPGYSLVLLPLRLPWLIDDKAPQDGRADGGADVAAGRSVCACNFDSDFHATASESSSQISAQNEVTFELTFVKPVRGAGEGVHAYAPVEIQISNLTGTQVPDGILTVNCDATSWGICHVGIPKIAFGPKDESEHATGGESLAADNSTNPGMGMISCWRMCFGSMRELWQVQPKQLSSYAYVFACTGSETENTPEAQARMWATVTDELLQSKRRLLQNVATGTLSR
jgi:hypothetical protein